MDQVKEQNKTLEKELNEMEITYQMQVQTQVLRMLKELTERGKSIKKTQGEMKVTLSEINKNLQVTSNGEDEAKTQVNDLEHKEEKSIQPEQQEEKSTKKERKKERIEQAASGTSPNVPTLES